MLKQYGINVPAGEVAHTADEARDAGARLRGSAWMVKAQISAGGRGQGAFADATSGIRSANSLDEIHAHADTMLGKSLLTAQTGAEGLAVERVYVEQAVAVERELALSLLVDERSRRLTLLLFARGGGDIENLAVNDPDSVHRVPVGLAGGVDAGRLAAAVTGLGLAKPLQKQLTDLIANIVRLFCEKDAALVEINPLAVCDGKLLALDAKMTFDKNALFRQPEIVAMENEIDNGHRLAGVDDFNHIPLDGDIACLTVGAGLSMATLDAIRHYGGRPANFLDLPPDSKVNRVVGALEALLANPRAGSLLVNVFGGGIMRCDTVADALLLVKHGGALKIPLTVRLSGTNSELANRRLKESLPGARLAANLAQAAEFATAAARGEAAAQTATAWGTKLFAALQRPLRRGAA